MARRDLAGLAALGALGYMLTQGGGRKKAPVEDRVGEDVVRSFEPDVTPGDAEGYAGDGMRPMRNRGAAPRIVAAPTVSSRYPDETERALRNYPAPSRSRATDTGDEAARLARRYPAPAAPRAIDTGDEAARLARRYPGAAVDRIPGSSPEGWTGGTGERVTGNELTRNLDAMMVGRGPTGLTQLGALAAEAATARGAQRAYNTRAAARRGAEGLSAEEAELVRKRLAEAAAEGGMKRGGKVKAKPVKKMASGGVARSSASKRADGIATKGKTRGKMY